ncbi:Hypothetical protein CAP_2551 [Chondromyces apiculatus DSM 436]|uniref:Uncharacterized protein n=2 Tax=Chondromyces apiculatus TaxID=51 RepID=A0A017TIL4_9BACT|nr:Hypothetical protein CAP_2551 [Chondromyces apiculatus DSM 436]
MTGDDVLANNWNIILRDSDIGSHILHVPIPISSCLLAPLWQRVSSSKSYFGPSSVVAGGKPIAAALESWKNWQLNCNDPLSLPTGVAFSWSTVVCGLTLGDVFGGFVAMSLDMAMSYFLGKIGGKFGKWYAEKHLAEGTAKWFVEAVEQTASAVFLQLIDSPPEPLIAPGPTLEDPFTPDDLPGMIGHGAGDMVDCFNRSLANFVGSFADDDAVEQH